MSVKTSIVKAKDVMRRDVVTIDGMATVREAVTKMRSENVTALVVDKRHPNDAWGIVTIPDLVRDVIAPRRSPDDTHVYEVMTKPVISADPSDSIQQCMETMTTCRCRHLPIVNDGKLLGIVSIGDLVKKMLDEKEIEVEQLSQYITGTY